MRKFLVASCTEEIGENCESCLLGSYCRGLELYREQKKQRAVKALSNEEYKAMKLLFNNGLIDHVDINNILERKRGEM